MHVGLHFQIILLNSLMNSVKIVELGVYAKCQIPPITRVDESGQIQYFSF